jgi:hypothetical protein
VTETLQRSFLPQAPATLDETGLTSELVIDLVLKSPWSTP